LRKSTDAFSFEVPDGWETFTESRRLIANGPGGEVVILSSWVVVPDPGTQVINLEAALDELEKNARRSAVKAASDPALTITKPLGEDIPAGGIYPCWTLLANDGQVFLGEAIVRGLSAVMLATYEVPLTENSARAFSAFLRTFGFPAART
jgi:hypothetical protein